MRCQSDAVNFGAGLLANFSAGMIAGLDVVPSFSMTASLARNADANLVKGVGLFVARKMRFAAASAIASMMPTFRKERRGRVEAMSLMRYCFLQCTLSS